MNTVNDNDTLRYSGSIQSNCLALTYDTPFLNHTVIVLNTPDILEPIYHLVSSALEGKTASFPPQHIFFINSSSSFQGIGLSTCSDFMSIFMLLIWISFCYWLLRDGNLQVPIFHHITDVFSPAISNFI
jgi:hypothetical protein